MKVLGIYHGHNPAICLLADGKPLFAAQEERYAYAKNMFGFPWRAIKALEKVHGIRPDDCDAVAVVNRTGEIHAEALDSPAYFKAKYTRQANDRLLHLKAGLDPLMRGRLQRREAARQKKRRFDLMTRLHLGDPERLILVDHHQAHAASAYFAAPWAKDEPTLVLTADGGKDETASTVYLGQGTRLDRLARSSLHASLGQLWSWTCFFLGLNPNDHEWKVMGLAPYAKLEPELVEFYRREIVPNPRDLTFETPNRRGPLWADYPRLVKALTGRRFDQIAASLQTVTEEVLADWLRAALERTGAKRVVAAGGVFMNVKANKLLLEADGVESFFPMPSAGDETTAFGAAYLTHVELTGQAPESLEHLYLGEDIDESQAEAELRQAGLSFSRPDDIETLAAEVLAGGGIVARCAGPMEFGARALGNRSIMADPRRLKNVGLINRMIKARDFWMPFAPSILAERAGDYLLNPKGARSPFMTLTFATTPRAAEEMPAALHAADGSARVHLVEKEANPAYHRILSLFNDRTGVGGVLNTSFNLHGFPVVLGAREAVEVFVNSGLEKMILGPFWVEKGD